MSALLPPSDPSCCAANDDRVAGDGTALADASIDCGRERASGRAKLLANEAKEGNGEDGEVIGTGAGVVGTESIGFGPGLVGDETYMSFTGGWGGDGVRGGGGWPSEAPHASRAARSSSLTKGSNSLRTSCVAAALPGSEGGVSFAVNIGWSNIDGSRTGRGLGGFVSGTTSSASSGFASCHGLGDTRISGVFNDATTAGAAMVEVESGSSFVDIERSAFIA